MLSILIRHIIPQGFLLILLLALYPVRAQSGYIPPAIPSKYEKELREAVLTAQGGRPAVAESSMQSHIKKFPTWTAPRHALSQLYYECGRKQEAIGHLEDALHIDTLSQLAELYTLGRIYEEISAPERAWACYSAVIEKGIHMPGLVQRATASLQALEKKRALWGLDADGKGKGEDEAISLIPFASEINTPNHEALGRWTLDGRQMIFTRLLYQQEDIFIATLDDTGVGWIIEDFPFNTPQNEGAHAISPDGTQLVFTSCNRPDGRGSCDLYLSVLRSGAWTTPVNMGAVFNTPSWEGQPCFGLDGMTLFFSSSRPGGMGARDIWYSRQLAPGKWSAPINAGPGINTPDNEESPFVHFDGQTLYFMRDGKDGLGGYDLYIARRALDGTWQTAINMGAPINSGADEGALSLHPDGRTAVITRESPGQKNDLFSFELPEPFRAVPQQALFVTLRDQKTRQPLRGRVEVFEVSRQDTIRLSQWTDEAGQVTITIKRHAPYGLIALAEDYLPFSGHLEADTMASRTLNLFMTAVEAAVDEVMILQNVFFETGSAQLLPASEPELNKLFATLIRWPGLTIEIRGHTDDVGDAHSNQRLSEARAQSVYAYLTDRGIEAERLSYLGFGESRPLEDNATAAGRRLNRRTEFRVRSME